MVEAERGGMSPIGVRECDRDGIYLIQTAANLAHCGRMWRKKGFSFRAK